MPTILILIITVFVISLFPKTQSNNSGFKIPEKNLMMEIIFRATLSLSVIQELKMSSSGFNIVLN